jgi:hypothetical protein
VEGFGRTTVAATRVEEDDCQLPAHVRSPWTRLKKCFSPLPSCPLTPYNRMKTA